MLRTLSMQKKLIGALAIMATIALLSVGWFSLRSVADARARADAATGSADMVDIAVVAGELVHELQRERGMSVGFVASSGEQFGTRIGPARASTDEALTVFDALSAERLGDVDAEVRQLIQAGRDDLDGLGEIRRRVDALEVEAGQVAGYFTDAIEELIDGMQTGFAQVDELELLTEGAAYMALAEAKEAAGQQRAQLNAVFAADAFTPDQVVGVGMLMGEQEALLHDFEMYASDGIAEHFHRSEASSAFATVAEMESTAFGQLFSGGFGIAPTEWFDAATARIDLLYDVEQAQAAHMTERATAISSAATRGAFTDLALSVVSIVVMLGLALTVVVWVRRGVIRPLSASAASLAGSSHDMSAVATQVGSNAEETAAQAGVVASAGEQVSQSVQAVATAVEELTSSIAEIAHNANEATGVAQEAVGAATETTDTISELGESSAEIGKVIELITAIAEQTNLLSLNATIEAARAGEAGKGFAVVANEVKELANQTSKATDEVGERIKAIQDGTARAITAIDRISEVVTRISDLQTTIASAVEEQNSATGEIARRVNEAAQGSSEIAANITSVATAARDTTEGATRTQVTAAELATMARDLDRLVFGASRDGAAAAAEPTTASARHGDAPHGTSEPSEPLHGPGTGHDPAARELVSH